MRADGSGSRRLTSSKVLDGKVGLDFTPRWSPDGSSLAVTTMLLTSRGRWARVRAVPLEDSSARTISPYTVSPDGTELRKLTDDALEQFEPVWQPAPPAYG